MAQLELWALLCRLTVIQFMFTARNGLIESHALSVSEMTQWRPHGDYYVEAPYMQVDEAHACHNMGSFWQYSSTCWIGTHDMLCQQWACWLPSLPAINGWPGRTGWSREMCSPQWGSSLQELRRMEMAAARAQISKFQQKSSAATCNSASCKVPHRPQYK